MKVFIALALVSVALATPVIEPVQLPPAPLPAIETMPYIAMPEPIDISPAFVPVEVLEALRLQEIPAVILAEVAHADTAFEALKVAAPLANEIPAEPVKFVDVAENIEVEPFVAEELAAPSAEAVKVVDFPEIIEAEVAAPLEAVRVVEVAENIEAAPAVAEKLAAPSDDEIPAEPVNFVDIAENIEYEVVRDEVAAPAAEEIPAEAVKFVDIAENIETEVVRDEVAAPVAEAVKVVDAPLRYPGKVYDNPMLR